MPDVPQYDWSKLQPSTPERSDRGSRTFPTHEYKEAHKKSKHSGVKLTRPPKVKLKDKRLFNDIIGQNIHIRNIYND